MLNVNGLTIAINGVNIVKNLQFSVPKGKITSIIGESGSGKSITIAALLGILPHNVEVTGEVIFHNKNLMNSSNKELVRVRRAHIFTIFQDAANSFNPSVKMGRQLYEFSGRRLGDTVREFRVKMAVILKELELAEEVMGQYPFELSGGMLQRCMIACALYIQPELLIADESTSALDVVLQKELIGLLMRLNEEQGTTILFITHDLDVVAEVADKMIVLHGGEVVETGDVVTIFERPTHAYTKKLLSSRFS